MSKYRNSSRGSYVNIALNKKEFDKLVKQFPNMGGYRDDFRYNDEVEIAIRKLSVEIIVAIIEIFKGSDNQVAATVMQGYLNAISTPDTAKLSNLKRAEPIIVAWLRENLIRGWVFKLSTELPELVTDVVYHPSEPPDRPACVRVNTLYWSSNDTHNGGFSFGMSDIAGGKTAEQVFLDHGYIHEDRGLAAAYDLQEKTFLKYRDKTGMQFLANGEYTHDKREKSIANNARIVIDFPDRPDKKDYRVRAVNNLLLTTDGTGEIDEEQVTRVPLHPYLWCFDLAKHEFGWYRVTDMMPYVYNPKLRELLILPQDHSDLIDALVSDLDIITEDIVAGKSGGTTILCQGKPGTGKTLSAEVYAESVERPLYRIHSGQLGTEAEGLEETLLAAMAQAERWRAILLIDEADVFLMQRTDNLERNAIVGVFLRVLEYYRGLLFLTTNRVDAIDDAIISRCIAVIRYENPGIEERNKIWHTQFDLAGVDVSEELISDLSCAWDCSGRDIKGLVRLTARFCKARGKVPEFDDFRRMALFRGMV